MLPEAYLRSKGSRGNSSSNCMVSVSTWHCQAGKILSFPYIYWPWSRQYSESFHHHFISSLCCFNFSPKAALSHSVSLNIPHILNSSKRSNHHVAQNLSCCARHIHLCDLCGANAPKRAKVGSEYKGWPCQTPNSKQRLAKDLDQWRATSTPWIREPNCFGWLPYWRLPELPGW